MSTEIIQNILVKKTTKPVSFCDRWRLCQWTDAPLFWHHCSFFTLVLNWVLSESAWPPERLDRTCCGDNCSISEFDVHHCVTPNEKYGFITKNFVTATAEYRCFISGLSHHPCSTFNQLFLGKPSECVDRTNAIRTTSQLLYGFGTKLYALASPRTWCKIW